LGPIEVWDGERRVELGVRRQAVLFALFVVRANRAVSADGLIDALWGDGGATAARKRVQMAVRRLRQALRPVNGGGLPVLETVAGGYLLRLEPGELDSELFAVGVAGGRAALQAGEFGRAREAARGALSLWRGPPLAEAGFEDFAQDEIRRLDELRLAAFEVSFDAALALGEHDGRSELMVSHLSAALFSAPSSRWAASESTNATARACSVSSGRARSRDHGVPPRRARESVRVDRLRGRMPPGPSRDGHEARTVELESILTDARIEDFVENQDRSPREVALEVLARAAWL
jgi:DNA-binding SARP family transcriptional activator